MYSLKTVSTLRIAPLVMMAVLLAASSAWATYPGQNGRIAFIAHSTGTWQLYTVNPDGTDLFQVTSLPPTENFFWLPTILQMENNSSSVTT